MRTHRFAIAGAIALALAASMPAAQAADAPGFDKQSLTVDVASLATIHQETSKDMASEPRMSMHQLEGAIDMSVRAKVLCTNRNLTAHTRADGSTVEAANVAFCGVHKAMYGPDGKQIPGNGHKENEIFGEYSPNVSFSMYITNPHAHRQFEPGKMYYVDFTEAPA